MTGIWIPFAALAGLGALAAISSLGLGENDWVIFGYAVLVTAAVPVIARSAFRDKSANATFAIVVVGLVMPLTFIAQVRPDYSEPLQLLARATVVFGAMAVVGGLLLLRARRTP